MIAVETLFVLALRVLGVWMVYTGLHALLDAGFFKLGYFNYPESSPNYYLITGLFSLVFGVYLVSGAGSLLRIVYPEDDLEADDSDSEDSANVR